MPSGKPPGILRPHTTLRPVYDSMLSVPNAFEVSLPDVSAQPLYAHWFFTSVKPKAWRNRTRCDWLCALE